MILADFICPIHGRFEAMVERDAETAPCPRPSDEFDTYYGDGPHELHEGCGGEILWFKEGAICGKCAATPECGITSPWSPSPIAVHTAFVVSATRGKSDPPPHKLATDTRALGEGQSYSEWRAQRKKLWRDHDYRIRKERG